MVEKIWNYLLACRAQGGLNMTGCPFLPKKLFRYPLHNRSAYNTFIDWIHILQLGKADWIVDAGANHGDFSSAASACFPSACCLLVEPLPNLHAELEQRCVNSKGRWRLEKSALGAAECVMTLHVAGGNDAIGSLAGFSDEYVAVNKEAKPSCKLDCRVRKLDEVAAQYGIDAIDLLKIDVEGFEFEALEGGKGILARTQAVIIEVSLIRNPGRFSSSLLSMLTLLTNAGFHIVRVIPSLPDTAEPWKPMEFNILARRSSVE